jgi:Cu/Ag efflux pump CusA
VLCSFLLGGSDNDDNKKEQKEPFITRAMRSAYNKILAKTIAHPKPILIGTAILFVISGGLFLTLGRSFLPGFNEGSFTINVSTLPGISLEESDAIGREAEKIIMSVPEITTVARKTGRAELDEHSLGVNVSEIEAPYKLDGRTRGEVARELRTKLGELPGVNVEIGQPISHRLDAMLSGTKSQIAIKLFGNDLNQLFMIGNQIKNSIKSVPGLVDVNIEQQIERPELAIKPRRELMAQYGVTPKSLQQAIQTALSGTEVSQVYEDGIPFSLVVMLNPASKSSIDAVSNTLIDSNEGKIPLSNVATISSTTGPNTINRENVKRRIVISANVEGGDLRGAVNSISEIIDNNIKLPEGYYVEYGGQFESEASASRTLAWTSLGALFLVFMLLYQEFKNLPQCILILINIPLAMIGGVLILVLTGAELNIPAIIGFISLLGITTRNGMLLVNRYNALQSEGFGLKERIMAGSSDRLLPIIMTALTSALALIPLAVNGDAPGNEIQSPMAVVILGGLLSATLLNLLVVPAIYYLMNKQKQ